MYNGAKHIYIITHTFEHDVGKIIITYTHSKDFQGVVYMAIIKHIHTGTITNIHNIAAMMEVLLGLQTLQTCNNLYAETHLLPEGCVKF